MEHKTLFSAFQFGSIGLKNRIVMAPMTRSRAIGNIPNELIATYYEQRAGAGLIITEGTSPSPNGLGYSRIPGIFSFEQVEGWKKVTKAVHAKGGRIFVQLMHTGRISHQDNLPKGATVLAPSAVKPAGQMWTDANGMQDFPTPKEMSAAELFRTKEEFVSAAKNAIAAGFDGVELHGANGYLLEQFISPASNQRTDGYGGSIENRCKFVLEVVEAVCNAIGKDRVGIRFSPYGVASDMPHYPEIDKTYTYLANKINELGLVYVHLVDHSAMGAPQVPATIKKTIRDIFKGVIILSGGYDLSRAELDIENKSADLVGFGRPFINNPDLVYRLQNGKPISTDLDMNAFYTPDEKGYTDYPFFK
jgi:N-ethylmaleimide reductase